MPHKRDSKHNRTAQASALLATWIIPIALLEISSALIFKSRVQQLNPNYLAAADRSKRKETNNNFELDLGRGYPRNYFQEDSIKGFDIRKNFKPLTTSTKPSESEPYKIWGNSLGCFDEEPPEDKEYAIYLAGDSFTWGYSPYSKKFGTILEKNLNKKVAKCGVTHTGQAHQLQKLREFRAAVGYQPETVIVNVYYNDIDNDFSHPHSTVIDGFLVDSVQNKYLSPSNFCTARLSKDDLKLKLTKAESAQQESQRLSIINKSALLSIVRHVYRQLAGSKQPCLESKQDEHYGVYSPINKLYTYKPYKGYPINASIAQNNRLAITEWIKDSKNNNYKLIFSFIDIGQNEEYVAEFRGFIESNGGIFYAFGDFTPTRNIDYWNSLRWKYDGHFNEKGNLAYASYLEQIINIETSKDR